MKTIVKTLLVSALFAFCLMGQCIHQHDEACGYNGVEDSSCIHECIRLEPREQIDPFG